jgi:hypothetical protein
VGNCIQNQAADEAGDVDTVEGNEPVLGPVEGHGIDEDIAGGDDPPGTAAVRLALETVSCACTRANQVAHKKGHPYEGQTRLISVQQTDETPIHKQTMSRGAAADAGAACQRQGWVQTA